MTNLTYQDKIVLAGCLILNEKNEILLLYRSDYHHYETPGGKVRLEESSDINDTEALAKTAERELYEELGDGIKIEKLKFFGKVESQAPDGRKIIANKFITRIIAGTPRINEPERFSKLDYLPIANLEEFPISPDLKLFVDKLKEYVGKN